MVDPDRLDQLTGGKDKSDKSSGDSKKKKSSSGKKKKKDQDETKKDKLEHLKGGSSSSKSKTSGSGTEDIKTLLFTLANMDAYTRVLIDYDSENFNRAQEQAKEDFARDVAGEITNFLGVFDVRSITDKYGYDWKNVMETAIENKDMGGQSLRTNSGDVDREDVKELLDCIANVILFIEGTLRDKQNKDNLGMKQRTIMNVSKSVYDQYKDIISKNEVQRIAERHGYDWKEDVIEDVLENQDFKSKINQHK